MIYLAMAQHDEPQTDGFFGVHSQPPTIAIPRIAQLRAEIASASATLCRATAALRALERRQLSDDDGDGPSYSGAGSRSRSEGPHGSLGGSGGSPKDGQLPGVDAKQH